MKVKEYAFEGTADEYIQVAGALRGNAPQTQPLDGQLVVDNRLENNLGPSEKSFVTKDQARKILTRRRLSEHLKKFIGELYRMGDKSVKSDHLRKALGFDDATDKKGADRFRGLMGAFGRRIKHDVGSDVKFFDDSWNADEGQKEWKLPPSVREAIKELGWYR